MHLTKNLAGLLILVLLTACGPSVASAIKTRAEVIRKATTNIPCVKEFHAVYPDALINLYFEGRKRDSATIQITEVIHDRYELTLTIDFKIDPKNLEITGYSAPLIMLLEITSIEGDANSQLGVSYGTNFRISQDHWRKIVEAGGQFWAAGIEVKTNEPVAGIEEYKTKLRRPPIQ